MFDVVVKAVYEKPWMLGNQHYLKMCFCMFGIDFVFRFFFLHFVFNL